MSMLAIKTTVKAEVFITTYGLGNEYGFGYGKWFTLGDYADKDEFLEAAVSYVNGLGDFDPELCFPDYEAEFEISEFN